MKRKQRQIPRQPKQHRKVKALPKQNHDTSVICDTSKLTDKGCDGAPDWIIEIVSPGSRRMDYFIKLFKYRTAWVHEYWIVDPMKNRIIVYNFEHNSIDEYSFEDTVPTAIYKDLSIDFKNLDL